MDRATRGRVHDERPDGVGTGDALTIPCKRTRVACRGGARVLYHPRESAPRSIDGRRGNAMRARRETVPTVRDIVSRTTVEKVTRSVP